MPKGLNSFRQQTMREMMLLMNDMNRLTSSQGFRDSLNLGLTDQIMSANKAALTLGQTLQKSVNPLTGNLNLTAFNNELKRSSMTLTDYSKQLSQLGSVGQESFKSLTKAIISAETPLTASSKLAQEMGVVIGNTMRWQAASSAIHGVLNTASQAVSYVRNLDSSLNDIRIVTGQSEEQMERFARQANQAAKELNSTTNQYAKAALIYYQQGLSDKQVAERTETTIKLANVTGQAAKSVSNEMTAIWNNFYNGSKSLEYYADVITALGATTASSSEEIAKGLSKFSSIAQTTGLSYEYATSALSTVVAATRQSADSVGTSFKTLFSRLQGLNLGQTLDDGTTLNKYSKALLTAGVNIKQANGQLKDMDTILSELSTKWEALGNAQKVALAQTVGGARNYSTFMSLMENWDDFTTNLQTAYNAQGTLQRQADIYADSWQAASAHVRASAESIYSNLIDDKAFKGMINGFGDVLDVVGRATDTMGGFKGILMQTAAIATRAYGPQLAEGLSNLGYSAMNLLPGGKARVEGLRQQALENLMANTNMSQLERDYAKSFDSRNRSYLEGVQNHRISQINQPIYQSLMGQIDTLEDIAISADQNAAQTRQNYESGVLSNSYAIGRDIAGYQSKINTLEREYGELETRRNDAFSSGNTGLGRELHRQMNENQVLRDQYDQYLINRGAGRPGNDFVDANAYRNRIEAYRAQALAENRMRAIGDVFSRQDFTGWGSKETAQALRDLEKIIKIGDGNGGQLHEIAGLTSAQSDSIKQMVSDFGKIQGLDISNPEVQEFFTKYGGQGALLNTLGYDLSNIAQGTTADEIKEQILAGARSVGQEERATADLNAADVVNAANIQARGARAEAELGHKGFMSMLSQNLAQDKTGFTTALVNSASNIAGLSSMFMAGTNALKVFNSETATTMDKMGAFTSLAMTAPMGLRGIANIGKDFGALLPGEIGAAAKAAGGSAKTFGVGLGSAAVIAAIVGVMAAVNQSEKESYDNQIKSLTQVGIASKQNATIAKESSESFGAVSQAYQKSIGDLSQYQEGATEYYNSLLSANEQALELINTYGLTGESYSVDSKGLVQINAGELIKQQETLNEQAKQASINAIVSSGIARVADISNTLYTQTDRPLVQLPKAVARMYGYGEKTLFTGQDIINLFNAAQQENPDLKFGDWWNQAGFFGSTGVHDTREVGQKTIRGYIGDFLAEHIPIFNGLGSTAVQKAFGTFNDKQTQAVLEKMANGQAIAEQGTALQKELASVLNTIGAVSEDQTGRTQLAALQLAANADTIDIQKLFGAALNIFRDGAERGDLEAAYKTHVDENVNAATLSALKDDQIRAAVQASIEYNELKTLIDKETSQLNLSDKQIREYKNFNTATQNQLESLIQQSVFEGNNFWQYFTDKNSQAGAKLLESIFENINLEDFGLTEKDSVDKILGTIAHDLSMSDRGILEGYITEFGTQFGPELAGTIAKNLVNAEGTGIDKSYENLLSRLDTSNIISTLYSAEQGIKLYERDSVRSGQLKEIVKKGMESIGGELGFFKSLWNNGDFQNLFTTLTDNFRDTSLLTAETIAQAANKVGILNQAINTEAGGLTSGGIASIMREVALGNISADEMSSEFVQAMTVSSQGDTIRQETLDNIASLSDYSESSIAVMEKAFANQGKAFTQSFYQNQFWDKPLQEVISQLPTGVENQYRELLLDSKNQGLTSRQFQQRVRSEMPDFYKYITTIGSKKGDIKDVFNFWDAMGVFNNGNADTGGLTSPFLHNGEFVGLNPEMFMSFDENGNMIQSPEQIVLEEALKTQFENMGITDKMIDADGHIGLIDTEQEFRNLAMAYAKARSDLFGGKTEDEIMAEFIDPLTLYVGEQGGQQMYWDSNAAKEGAAILDQNNFLSEAEVQAYFNANRGKIIDPKTGKLLYGYDNENAYQQFLQDYNLSDNFTGIKSDTFANKPGGVSLDDFNKALNEGRKDSNGNPIETSYTLEDYLQAQEGIYNSENKTFDYDAALEALTGLGGMSAENAKSLLQEQVKQGSSFTTTIRDPNNKFRPTTITIGGENGISSWDEFQNQVDQYGQMSDSELAANQIAQEVKDATLSAQAQIAIANGQMDQAAIMAHGMSQEAQQAFVDNLLPEYREAYQEAQAAIYSETAPESTAETASESTPETVQESTTDTTPGYITASRDMGQTVAYAPSDSLPGHTPLNANQQNIDAANYLLSQGMTPEQISEITGLPLNEIQNMVNEGQQIDQTTTSNTSQAPITNQNAYETFGQYGGIGQWETAGGKGLSDQQFAQEVVNELDKQAYNVAHGGGQYINPFTGEVMDKTSFDQMYNQIKQIAENTGDSVELANELNEAVGNGEAPGLTGETNNQNQPVDKNGNPVDENGNPINFGEEKQDQTSTAGGGGVGDSGNVGGPTAPSGGDQISQVIGSGPNGEKIVLGSDGQYYPVDSKGNVGTPSSTIPEGTELTDAGATAAVDAVINQNAAASGQNNNLIPKFASGLNESTIAMTGELGPELRIRADGSMDLLGKHGREYNWIEPTDKIYTAAQTVSILGDKKIREMTHFASGINNFIPGYYIGLQDGGVPGGTVGTLGSSGGGGGGGRSTSSGPAEVGDELENHRYDPNWLKYRDILDRYYTILQQMENLANALARVAELADRAWGKQRQEAITETIKLQEQQIEAQKRYLSEINTYLSEDRGYLTSMIDEFVHDWNQLYPDNPLTFTGAQFDKNGVLLNYRELTEAMVDAWNMSTTGASYARNLYGIAGGGTSGIYTAAASGIDNTDFSSLLSSMKGLLGLGEDELSSSKYVNLDPQTKLEEQMKDIQFYTETLNLLEQQQIVLQQMYEQLLDTRLQQVQVELQYKITLKDNALALLDYQLSQVKNDAYSAADAISLITDETLDTMSRLDDYADSIRKMFNVNANGYADYDNWIVKMSDDTEQLTKDLTAIEDLHQKFWDEESQSYRDKYKLDEEGNIVFPEIEEEEESGDFWSRLWHSDPYDTLEGEEHTFDEYSKRVMKLYEKYYNIYSSYLPNPDEFLEYIDSKNEDDAGLFSFASLLGEGEEEDADKAKKAKRDIANYEEALKQLQQLATVIEDHSLYVDIDKFTSEIKNIDDVREQLQNIYEDLSQDFDGIENKIKEAGENLLDEAGKVVINSYADVQKLLTVFNEFQAQRIDDDAFAKFLDDPEGFFADISDLNNNFDFQNFTAQEIETLKGDMSQFLNFASSIKGNMLSQVDILGSSVKTYFKNIETEFAKFDNFKNLFNNWQNIIDLTGRSVTKLGKDIINAFSNRVIDNSLRKLESSKDILLEAQKEQLAIQERYNEAWAQYESYSGEDENRRLTLRQYADEMKDQLDKINKEAQEAQESFMNSWKESLEALQTEFEKNVKFAATVFEEGFSPYYQSLDMLSTAINREQQLKDLYLTSYQQAHDLSKLNRDIQQSIIDTDNLNSKRELRKIQKEVNDLQTSGIKLSSYDLDLIQKKYDLELARQALEDAKNAKSLVRLSRDNNGNWGYVYTANQDDIDEAEQNYEDAILTMEQANEDYLKNLENQLVSVWTQAEQEIAGLNTDDALYYEHVKEITDAAMQNIDFIKQQFNNAIGGNEYLENNVSGKAREIMQRLTKGFSDTILSAKTDVKDLDSIITTSIDNINQFADDSINAYSDFITRKAEVWQTAGKDIKDVAGIITGAMDEIDSNSQKAMGDTAAVLDRVATAFTDMIDKFDEKVTANLEKFLDAIAIYEKYGAALEKFIAASGEYIAERTYNLEGGVNDWSKLEKIYDILATDGKVWIKYIDETGAEVTKVLEASTEDTMAWLANAREYLVNIFQAMTGTTAEFETQQALDEFYNGVVDEYNDKGALNLNVTKGLLKAIIEAEDNDLKEYLTNKDVLTYNDKGELEEGQTGYLQLRRENEEEVQKILELLKEILQVKVAPVWTGGFGDGNGFNLEQWFWDNGYTSEAFHINTHTTEDTGGYTGHWQSADTGMYTGEWPDGSTRRNGRLAWLHQKELVLNAHDTENFLDAMEIVRQLDNLTNWMANGLDIFAPQYGEPNRETLQQEVTIHAEFPNVVDHSEIEQAMDNLVNMASQYVNRR